MSAPPRRSLRLSAIAAFSAAAIVLVAWAAIAAVLNAKWNDEIEGERWQNENPSNALTEQSAMERTIILVDIVALLSSPSMGLVDVELEMA